RVQGAPAGGGANANVTTGLTNNGTIELTDVSGSYGAVLTVTGGSLTNAGGASPGVIAIQQGANGGRTIHAVLDNPGTLNVGSTQGLTLNRASTQHLNSGTINVTTGDLQVSQSGTSPSLTNTGTIAVGAGRTFTISGGTFTVSGGGALTGSGTLSVQNATWNTTPSFSNAVMTLAVSGSTINGPGTITNA